MGNEWKKGKVPGKMTEWNGVTDMRQIRAQKYNNAGSTNQWGNRDR